MGQETENSHRKPTKGTMHMKRKMIALVLAAALSCLLLASCSTPQQEDPALTAIKEQWTRCVIDRTVPLESVQISFEALSSIGGKTIKKEDFGDVLDICATLDIQSLTLEKVEGTDNLGAAGTAVHFFPEEGDSLETLYILTTYKGVVGVFATINGEQYSAYADGWSAFEQLTDYRNYQEELVW